MPWRPEAGDDAFRTSRQLAREEGILAGISSGAAAYAALLLAARPGAEGKTIVVLLADTGERHVTTAPVTERNM
jgi:cysteine synthase A